MNIFEIALRLAEAGHAGQKRKNKDISYFDGHIVPVVKGVERKFSVDYQPVEIYSTVLLVYKAAAALHDYLEDVRDASAEKLRETLLAYGTPFEVEAVMAAVIAITKVKGESYEVYLRRVKGNEIARYIKLRDLEHNMSDLEAGNLLDKYRLAHYYLSN